MTYLSQRDPIRAKVKIGKSILRIGDWGCTLTGVSMLSSFYGVYKSPEELAKIPWLFDASGRIIWGAIEKAFQGKIKFQFRYYTRNDKEIRKSIQGSPKTTALLQVNYGKHWVVAVAVEGKDYWIVDPIDGKKKLLSKAYPNITGSAHLFQQ